MDIMEAGCFFYVNVGTCTHLGQCKIFLLTDNKSGIVRLTVQHDMVIKVIFMYYPGDYLSQPSADHHSVELHPMNI